MLSLFVNFEIKILQLDFNKFIVYDCFFVVGIYESWFGPKVFGFNTFLLLQTLIIL